MSKSLLNTYAVHLFASRVLQMTTLAVTAAFAIHAILVRVKTVTQHYELVLVLVDVLPVHV